jgi:iron complex transport system substrate-binding protein
MADKMNWFLKPTGKIVAAVIFGLIIIGITFVLLNNSATTQSQTDKSQPITRTVTDMAGRQVTIPSQVHRIAVVPIPWASVIYTIDGSGKNIVGMNPSAKQILNKSILKTLAPEFSTVSTDFTNAGFTVNLEELLKLKPDLVIQWDYMDGEIKKIEDAGIPVVTIKYGTQQKLEDGITLMGVILGKEAQARKIIESHHETIADITAKTTTIKADKKPKVFFLRDAQLKTAGNQTYNNYLFELTGAENVARDIPGEWVNVNMEQVIAWNPEIIYISNFCDLQPGDFYNNTIKGQDWSAIDAVKNKRVYKSPVGIYRWDTPSTEAPLMMKWLAQIQHPVLFTYSMNDEIRTFYKEIFNYNISDAEISRILQK